MFVIIIHMNSLYFPFQKSNSMSSKNLCNHYSHKINSPTSLKCTFRKLPAKLVTNGESEMFFIPMFISVILHLFLCSWFQEISEIRCNFLKNVCNFLNALIIAFPTKQSTVTKKYLKIF